jgi:MOSC domain-containing protein YiiM
MNIPIRIEQLFISPGHNFFGHHQQPPGTNPTIELQEVECVADRGLAGDRFFHKPMEKKGQVTFFSADVFEDVCRSLHVTDKSPGVTRRNVIIRGVDLNTLVGKRFTIQGVEFEGMSECSPCYWMNDVIAPGAEAALHARGGLRARILTSGKLHVG